MAYTEEQIENIKTRILTALEEVSTLSWESILSILV